MAEPFLPGGFASPSALAGLLLIIPILLLYLLKPKPQVIPFPSTMFLKLVEKNKRFSSFLQRFIRDPILFMQLLVVALIILALAAPYLIFQEIQRDMESVVFVLDASASMQSTDESPTRFIAAKNKAKQLLTKMHPETEVSLILAASSPITVARQVSALKAANILDKLDVTDTPSNIGDAMLLARDFLVSSHNKKVIYVISDFAPSGGADPRVAENIAASQGITSELIKVGYRGANTGITNFNVKRTTISSNEALVFATIKNNHPVEYKTVLSVFAGDTLIHREQKTLEAGGEDFVFLRQNISWDEQDIRVELSGGDDLKVDDIAYAHISSAKSVKALLLTSSGSDKYLKYMLESLVSAKKIELSSAVLPVIPELQGYDLILFGNVDSTKVLPGLFLEIKGFVEGGGTLMILGSENLMKLPEDSSNPKDSIWPLMPVDMLSFKEQDSSIKIVKDISGLTDDVQFENVVLSKYYEMNVRDTDTETIMSTESGSPLVSYKKFLKGYVAYVGVNSDPTWSNLYYSSSFPIFYNQMIGFFTRDRVQTHQRLFYTGDYLTNPQEVRITAPNGGITHAKSIFLDKAGIYRLSYSDRTESVPVNLLNEKETNISGSSLERFESIDGYEIEYERVDIEKELFRELLFILIFVLFVEMILYRRRGLI